MGPQYPFVLSSSNTLPLQNPPSWKKVHEGPYNQTASQDARLPSLSVPYMYQHVPAEL